MSSQPSQLSDERPDERPWYDRLKRRIKRIFKKKQKPVPHDTPHLDDKLNKELDDWASQHKSHMENVDQHRASELLKSQLEEYQYELEQKRQRAQTGYIQKRHELSDTDDRLPYEPKPIELSWKTAFEKIAQVHSQKSQKSPRLSNKDAENQPIRLIGTESSGTCSISDEFEKASHLTDLLLLILKDNQFSSSHMDLPDLSNQQLAELSRKNMAQFEHLIVENTKECLFLSLPTAREIEYWDKEIARPGHMKKHRKKIQIKNKPNVEPLLFCPDCKPRHWRTGCTKFFRMGSVIQ